MASPEPSRDFTWIPPSFDTTGRNEGGYTFLKRMLQTAINTGTPVIFSDGQNLFEYTHNQKNKVFRDGVRQLDDVPAGATGRAMGMTPHEVGMTAYEMAGNMERYSVAQGVAELQQEGKITRPQNPAHRLLNQLRR